VLLEILHALQRRTGCVKVGRKEQNHRFVPPKPEQFVGEPKPLPRRQTSSPQPSPPSGEERERAVALVRSRGENPVNQNL